jgi:hypothetical protein
MPARSARGLRERRGEDENGQQGHGVRHAGDRRSRTRSDVDRGPRDRACGREAAEERGQHVRNPLSGQFHVGIVSIARHPVGDDGRQQRLDGAQHRHGQGG